jgi:hypothetical protein
MISDILGCKPPHRKNPKIQADHPDIKTPVSSLGFLLVPSDFLCSVVVFGTSYLLKPIPVSEAK